MRLMGCSRDRAAINRGVDRVASSAMAAHLCQVLIRRQIVPTSREEVPVRKSADLQQKATHRFGFHEFEAIPPQWLNESGVERGM